MNKLSLEYRYPNPATPREELDDDFGWLGMTVQSDTFKGSSGFWVQWQDVIEWGRQLESISMPLAEPLTFSRGYADGRQPTLEVKIIKLGNLGELEAQVTLLEYDTGHQGVRCAFRTTYAAIDLFGRDIHRLMEGDVEVAELLGV